MSFPTKPAFTWTGGWSDVTRKHPAMKFTEQFTYNWDARNYSDTKWYIEDFSFRKADGTDIHGRDKAISAAIELFAPFTAHYHEPVFNVVTETDDGWEMLGQTNVFFNLSGNPAPGEKKVSDASGKQWDVSVPSAFHCLYVNTDGGILFKRIEIMSDSSPPMKMMIKRGLIDPKELGH